MLREIAVPDAAGLMERAHYLRTSPTNAAPCFGWFDNDLLYAAAIYGPLHMPKGPKGWLELRRLVRAPDYALPLSSFLSATLRVLKRSGVPAVVTWADPAVGHHGGIYQATNWVYNPEGTHYWGLYPTHLMSTGDTLHVVPNDAVKVGREYAVS